MLRSRSREGFSPWGWEQPGYFRSFVTRCGDPALASGVLGRDMRRASRPGLEPPDRRLGGNATNPDCARVQRVRRHDRISRTPDTPVRPARRAMTTLLERRPERLPSGYSLRYTLSDGREPGFGWVQEQT